MIRAILFDWHGVLDKVSFDGLLNEAARRLYEYDDEFPIGAVKKIVVEPLLYNSGMDYARGKTPCASFWALTQKYPPLQGLEKYLLRVDPNEILWQQLPYLASRYRLGIVSDAPEDKAVLMIDFLGKQQVQFHPIVLSYQLNRLKVEGEGPSLYEFAAQRLGLSPQECLVVDDSQKNIDHAKQEMFETIHYKSGQLKF